MNRLIKVCVFSAVVVAGSLFSSPKAEAGYGYGFGYGYGYRPSYNHYYAPTYYAPTYIAPSYGYSYGGFCY